MNELWQTAPLSATVEHVLQRYHQTHREQLATILPLAEKVSRVHQDTFNQAVLPHLQHIQADLESHMMKEERVLFPLIQQGMGRNASMPVRMMMLEHEDHDAAIEQLLLLTDQLHVPEHACGSWQRLYAALAEFVQDLRDHIALENDILFPRALSE